MTAQSLNWKLQILVKTEFTIMILLYTGAYGSPKNVIQNFIRYKTAQDILRISSSETNTHVIIIVFSCNRNMCFSHSIAQK